VGRIADLATAEGLVRAARAEGRRIVLANGHFDLLHVGHVRYLRGARAEGGFLVVGVNGDASTARRKGAGRPILGAKDRATLVAALEGVDVVVVFEGDDVAELLERLRPDVHCKGTDYTEKSVPERETMRRLGGETRIVGDPKVQKKRADPKGSPPEHVNPLLRKSSLRSAAASPLPPSEG
jgi:rfaE bifunctional protein nucleotidyltransferase chain/domain